MSKTFSSLNIGGIIYKVKDKSSISTPVSQGLPGQVLVVSKNGTTEWKSIESIDSSIGLITTSLNKIDLSVRNIDSSVRSIDSSVSNLDASISKIDSSINELNNKIQRIDSSIGEIISNLDNREQGEDVLEEYNLVLDSSIHLIKVFTPYNCEWNLEIAVKDSEIDKLNNEPDEVILSPYKLSTLFGISSAYVTYSIDNTLEQEYYKRDYILQLKCKNEIKKTIELYIENSCTDTDYDIRLSEALLPYYNGKTFIQIISPTEWRIQETSSSGFINISPSSGVGSQNITLSYGNNDNITLRKTTLELYSLPDETLRKTLTIIQEGKPN